MRSLIEKFYTLVFSDPENPEVVPYANKVAIFYISIVLGGTVFTLIVLEIIKNISR